MLRSPIAQSVLSTSTTRTIALSPERGSGGAPGRDILVIEDDPAVAGVLRLALQSEGHTVDVAADGVVAPDGNGIYHAKVVSGFWLRVAWLWRQPLPDPVQVLLEIDRDAYTRYLHNLMQQAGS